jgi:hypothetical protein
MELDIVVAQSRCFVESIFIPHPGHRPVKTPLMRANVQRSFVFVSILSFQWFQLVKQMWEKFPCIIDFGTCGFDFREPRTLRRSRDVVETDESLVLNRVNEFVDKLQRHRFFPRARDTTARPDPQRFQIVSNPIRLFGIDADGSHFVRPIPMIFCKPARVRQPPFWLTQSKTNIVSSDRPQPNSIRNFNCIDQLPFPFVHTIHHPDRFHDRGVLPRLNRITPYFSNRSIALCVFRPKPIRGLNPSPCALHVTICWITHDSIDRCAAVMR